MLDDTSSTTLSLLTLTVFTCGGGTLPAVQGSWHLKWVIQLLCITGHLLTICIWKHVHQIAPSATFGARNDEICMLPPLICDHQCGVLSGFDLVYFMGCIFTNVNSSTLPPIPYTLCTRDPPSTGCTVLWWSYLTEFRDHLSVGYQSTIAVHEWCLF